MRARALAAILTSALLAACGGSGPSTPTKPATLVLDFTPNAIHTGIYMAVAHHYDRAAGVALHVIAPSASTDPIKLLLTGRTDFAILDIHDLAIARQRGANLVGIMAIVERPLASVIAAAPFATPSRLAGQTVGVTGAPSDLAVLRSILAGAGTAPRVRTVTIGFNAVADLLSRRVAAATAFWNDEGVTLSHTGRGFHVFRVDDYGAPAYPELVLTTTRALLRHDPGLARAVVHAIARGYAATVRDPRAGERAIESLVPGLSHTLVAEQLAAELPAFAPPRAAGAAGAARAARTAAIGTLDPATLRAWARWEARFGIVKRAPDVAAAFDPSLLAQR
jgi:NitT/TauT family transport system substrate-binding protein/putative hydroxymethylpyrimidine transport system substrate-binding protein